MLLISKASTPIARRAILWLCAVTIAVTGVTAVLMGYKTQIQNAQAADCRDIFDAIPKWVNDRIADNKSVYVQVANETGVPWEALAAVHYREFNLAVSNPNNGQGIYQLYSSGTRFTPGPVDRNGFIDQTRLAANFIQGKAVLARTGVVSPRRLTANESDLNLIKNTLFSYNGRAESYGKQAALYGYSTTNQPFEGSPYVMNKFDCNRSRMGLITTDGSNELTAKDTRMGAFTMYARLKGDAYWNSLQIGNIAGCDEATNTRLSCVWQLYNSGTNKYTYTTSYDERNMLIAGGYQYQDTAFLGINSVAPSAANMPVYHLRDNQNGSLLTTDKNEYDTLIKPAYGWKGKGIEFYADIAGSNSGYDTFRLVNNINGNHVFTSDIARVETLKKSGYTYENVAFSAMSKFRQETAPAPGQALVYRFGSMPNNGHFWTTSVIERDDMIRSGYRYEGVAWRANKTTTSLPVYRLYSTPMQKHLYTTDANEKNVLGASSSWTYEGIAWYSDPNAAKAPVYRLYSPSTMKHFLTADAYERSELIRTGIFRDEGVAWYQP